jgi:hypothetical protein
MLSNLLHQQRIYWKQRSSIKWVRLGDENTRFFHANATIRHRRNITTSLLGQDGEPVLEHFQKADLLWTEFKQRLGTFEFQGMLFNLNNLLTSNLDLSSIEELFPKDEIDSVIK